MGIWLLCPWTPVTLLRCPSYPTFTGKVILELRGRLPHILWAIRCSWAHTHQHGEASRLRKGGRNMLLNLGGFCQHPPLAPALERRVIGRRLRSCSLASKKEVIGAAAVTPYTSSPSVRLNVVRRIYKGSMGNRQNGGHSYMVSRASRSLLWPTGCRVVFLVVLR